MASSSGAWTGARGAVRQRLPAAGRAFGMIVCQLARLGLEFGGSRRRKGFLELSLRRRVRRGGRRLGSLISVRRVGRREDGLDAQLGSNRDDDGGPAGRPSEPDRKERRAPCRAGQDRALPRLTPQCKRRLQRPQGGRRCEHGKRRSRKILSLRVRSLAPGGTKYLGGCAAMTELR